MALLRQEKKLMRPATARVLAALFFFSGILLGIFVSPQYWNSLMEWAGRSSGAPIFLYAKLGEPIARPFRLGLDLQGGTHLIYRADLTKISAVEHSDSMDALRDVIERRVNLFGVAEPVVEVARRASEWRLIVELAGVKDINAAIRLIGETPFLEFREARPQEEQEQILRARQRGERLTEDPYFLPTPLSGRHVSGAEVSFDPTTAKPYISLNLTDEGAKIFADITKRNIGKPLAIYLDGVLTDAPIVQEEITGGKAQISGSFTPQSAKELAGRLKAGALPVPIELIAQQSVEASLGRESLGRSLQAGVIGFAVVAAFMLLWYRLPGLLSVLALLLYIAVVLAIFKLIPVTLTVAGIAGFILSIGMAVDANVLIFERMKEELRQGKPLEDAIREGFIRAWSSIRDSNVSSLITALILYWLGTSVVKGFALTLGIGILVSMFSAISVTRTLLIAVTTKKLEGLRVVFLSGITR